MALACMPAGNVSRTVRGAFFSADVVCRPQLSGQGGALAQLYEQADKALYLAKTQGRNRLASL